MKSKFNIVFEHIMSTITESGHAVSGAAKIKRENIQPSLKKLEEDVFIPLGITHDCWTAEIGSVGKKDYSGDIDIAVNYEMIGEKCGKTSQEMMKIVFDKLKEVETDTVRNGTTVSFKLPIQGDQQGEFVQVDFFPAKNLDFVKFTKYAPSQENSKYKGVHRFTALAAMIKAVTLAVADDAIDKNKYTAPDGRIYPAYRFKQLSIVDDGVFQVTKSYMGKSGKFVKTAQKDPGQTKLITTNPQEMLDMVFGKNKYSVKDLDSFETIWNNILFDADFPYPDKRDEIIIALWHSLNDQKDIVIPDELQQYVDEHHLIQEQ